MHEELYRFEQADHRITIEGMLKRRCERSNHFWSWLRDHGFSFHGVVRGMTAVFSQGNDFLVAHHFLDERPIIELMGEDSGFMWLEVWGKEEAIAPVCRYMEQHDFRIFVPDQPWIDGYRNDILASFGFVKRDYHLQSPKHKIMIWALGERHSFLLEWFLGFDLPPYGVGGPINWPNLGEIVDYEVLDLFEYSDEIPWPTESTRSARKVLDGEGFEVAEAVDERLLNETKAVVQDVMTRFSHVVVPFSGGKDSGTVLQLVLHFLHEHPDCKTKVTVISGDTGIENPLIKSHIDKIKEKVEELPYDLDFLIVRPDVEDSFYACVFGDGYMFPSHLNKWCVSRLKIFPADRVLHELVQNSEGEICVCLGVRDKESRSRKSSIEKHFNDAFFGKHRIPGIVTCAPIRFWSAADVITYLVRTPVPWSRDYGNYELINLYGTASGGVEECPIGAMLDSENDEGVKSCTSSGSGARFGCYACTVIKEDSSLATMAQWYPELKSHVTVRKLFKAVQDIRYGSLTGYLRRRNRPVFISGLGDLTIHIRHILLQQMLSCGIRLSKEEVNTIYRKVRQREVTEGIAITPGFRKALFAMLPEFYGYTEMTFSPLWDPWGAGVDSFTSEDVEAIARIKARKHFPQNIS